MYKLPLIFLFLLFTADGVQAQPFTIADTARIASINDRARSCIMQSDFNCSDSLLKPLIRQYYLSGGSAFYTGSGKGREVPGKLSLSLNMYGVSLMYRSEYDSALACFNNSFRLRQHTGDKDGMSSVLNNISNIHYYRGHIPSALEFQFRALKIEEELKDESKIASSLNNIGSMYNVHGNQQLALKFLYRALKIREKIGDPADLAQTVGNIGIIYQENGDFKNGMKYQRLSLEYENKAKNLPGIASSYLNIGSIFYETGNYDSAVAYFNKALKIRESVDDKDGIAACYINLGNVFQSTGKHDDAFNFFKRALNIFQSLGDDGGKATACNSLGSCERHRKNYGESLKWLSEAYEITEELNDKENQLVTLSGLSETYGSLGDYRRALNYHLTYTSLKDSLYNMRSFSEAANMRSQYDLEKKEQEARIKDVEQKAKLQQQKVISYSATAGGMLMLMLAFISVKRYREKKRLSVTLQEQNAIIAEKNKDITDSINYACNIQQAILPDWHRVQADFPESFVFYRPRDIVSGDFYWYLKRDSLSFFAVADCTGHGVPGAFMSMIGSSLLTHIVAEKGIVEPSKILEHLNKGVMKALKQSETMNSDGMDIALVRMHEEKCVFSGANRPLFLIREGQVLEWKGSKTAIGGRTGAAALFSSHELELRKGDQLYLFTDGITDQFGGEKGKKLSSKRFRELLLKISSEPLTDQQRVVARQFENWKAGFEQTDDICVVGLKIS